tara:strand:+ start:331 stop:1050 length:720 start_codon:yes stop_codon:yes gene_type:complete
MFALLASVAAATATGQAHADSDRLVLATADTAPYSTVAGDGFYDRLLTAACARIGRSVQIEHYPSERGLIQADRGRVDGEFARTAAVADGYHNLIVVPEPLSVFRFVAVGPPGRPLPTTFGELSDLHVAYINGWKIYEDTVSRYRSLTIVENEEQLFAVLRAGRVDVVLYSRYRAAAWSQRHPEVPLAIADTALATRDMHLLLHRSRSDLVPEIDAALRALRDDGTYTDLYVSAFGYAP